MTNPTPSASAGLQVTAWECWPGQWEVTAQVPRKGISIFAGTVQLQADGTYLAKGKPATPEQPWTAFEACGDLREAIVPLLSLLGYRGGPFALNESPWAPLAD